MAKGKPDSFRGSGNQLSDGRQGPCRKEVVRERPSPSSVGTVVPQACDLGLTLEPSGLWAARPGTYCQSISGELCALLVVFLQTSSDWEHAGRRSSGCSEQDGLPGGPFLRVREQAQCRNGRWARRWRL